jgi:uncharacterized metal-binding protein
MVDLPKRKVGIVACSGEELAEGTVTRLAALEVLERLRPDQTVTICLPLFLAGGESDRAFARFYPTITVDGCELRCAARATEQYSAKPAASIVVNEIVARQGLDTPRGLRRLNTAGILAVQATAAEIALTVDELIALRWDRRQGRPSEPTLTAQPVVEQETAGPQVSLCACGSGIPVQTLTIAGQKATLIALPALFEQFATAGKRLPGCEAELMEAVGVYNPIPAEQKQAYTQAVTAAYAEFLQRAEAVR